MKDFEYGKIQVYENISLLPIYGDESNLEYLVFEDALNHGLDIEDDLPMKQNNLGDYSKLRLINNSDKDVLIIGKEPVTYLGHYRFNESLILNPGFDDYVPVCRDLINFDYDYDSHLSREFTKKKESNGFVIGFTLEGKPTFYNILFDRNYSLKKNFNILLDRLLISVHPGFSSQDSAPYEEDLKKYSKKLTECKRISSKTKGVGEKYKFVGKGVRGSTITKNEIELFSICSISPKIKKYQHSDAFWLG